MVCYIILYTLYALGSRLLSLVTLIEQFALMTYGSVQLSKGAFFYQQGDIHRIIRVKEVGSVRVCSLSDQTNYAFFLLFFEKRQFQSFLNMLNSSESTLVK